jgi:drug/metabolite transporter (DMT)-like permease
MAKATTKAIFASIFAAIAMSTGPVAAKFVLKSIDPYSLMLSSSVLAFLSLSVIIAIREDSIDFKTNKHAHLRTGAFFIIVQVIPGIVWFNILPHIQSISAIMLKRTQPMVVLILSIILGHKKARMWELGLSLMALIGMFYVLDPNSSTDPFEQKVIYISAAIGCVIVWALQFIYAKRIFAPLNPLEANRTGIGAYMSVIAPVAFIAGNPASVLLISPWTIFALLYLGIIVFGLGLWAIFYALKILEPWNVTMILLLGPIAGITAAGLILNEQISTSQLAGATLVIAMLILSIATSQTNLETKKT